MTRSSRCATFAALLLAAFNISDAYDPETGFALGIYGPITQITQDDLAAAVLFDLDFRKHTDPDLRARLGPPIVKIDNLHPDLKVKVQLGASDGQKTTGVGTALDWLYGENGTQKVVGIVGGYYSAISMPIASNCEVFKTPQIAFGSTNRMLTDKTLYPWFLRTIAPDNFQGQAMWAWMNVAGVPSVVFFYRSLEAYGEGLFQVTFDEAFAVGQPSRVSGIGVDLTGDAEGDRTSTINRLDAIKALGTKFVIMVFSSPGYATLGLHAMDEQGMLYSSHQVLGADSLAIVESNVYKPSRGYPQGCMKFTPVTAGPLHSTFASTWHAMTPEDVYGPDARRRYNIDKFRAPLDQAATAKLVASDFTDRLPWFFSNFLVDAAYSFVVAINNLLNSGIPANQVHGEPLLKELRNLSFQGVTGTVAFDKNADRIADWELWNVKQEGGELESVAVWLATATDMYQSFKFRDPTSQELVWVTGETRLQAPTELTACALGQRWDETAGLCIFCQVNEKGFSHSDGSPACQACPLGTVSEQPLGSLACKECDAGSFRDGGLQTCTACAPGTYMAERGQSACIACPAGRFTSKSGALSCDLCGPGGSASSAFTTMDRVMDSNGEQTLSVKTGADSDSFCGCRHGYRQAGLNGGCVECKEGMVCKGLNETTIEEGYYADVVSAAGDLSVFKCFSDSDRCAGGVPGHTCAPGRKGLTCSECQDGKTPKSDGSCVECHGSDVGPFVVALSLGVICLIAAYHLVDTQNRVTQSHALLLAACAIGQLVTVTQQLGVVGKMAATWEEPIDSFMKILQLLALDLEVLRLNCVGTVDPPQRFGIKVTIIFMTIAVMLVIHTVFVSLRHKCQWRQRMHSLVGSIGMLFMVFNIAVTSAVLEPFQCEKHPNGKWTVRPYPSVLCWDDDKDHAQMVAGGAVAFVLVPVAFLVACYFVVKQFPKRMKAGDSQFLHAFAFLFFRFRASQHWYVLYQMVRNFGVAVVLLIPDAAMQVFVLELILLIGVCATIYLWPWRVDYANILDCIFGSCALMIVCLAGLFLDDDQKHLKGTAWLTLIFICACLFSTPLAIMYGLYCKYCRTKKPFQFFLCHHKSGSGAFVRLLKMHLQDSPQLKSDVFVDSDNLENLDRLLHPSTGEISAI